jgi:hypothetical protein
MDKSMRVSAPGLSEGPRPLYRPGTAMAALPGTECATNPCDLSYCVMSSLFRSQTSSRANCHESLGKPKHLRRAYRRDCRHSSHFPSMRPWIASELTAGPIDGDTKRLVMSPSHLGYLSGRPSD